MRIIDTCTHTSTGVCFLQSVASSSLWLSRIVYHSWWFVFVSVNIFDCSFENIANINAFRNRVLLIFCLVSTTITLLCSKFSRFQLTNLVRRWSFRIYLPIAPGPKLSCRSGPIQHEITFLTKCLVPHKILRLLLF